MTRLPSRLVLARLAALALVLFVAPSTLAEEQTTAPTESSGSEATASENTSTVPSTDARAETSVYADPSRAVPANTLGPNASAQAIRGQYLVEAVGQCGQCHTPRDSRGHLRLDEWLHGAPVPVTTPAGYTPQWVYKAPRIAGLPQHTDEEFVRLMTTGINRDGQPTRLPMPQFRLSEDDALAIAAYLRALSR